MTTTGLTDQTAKALLATMMSPNVADTNGEPANVVDVLSRIGTAVNRLADAVQGIADVMKERG